MADPEPPDPTGPGVPARRKRVRKTSDPPPTSLEEAIYSGRVETRIQSKPDRAEVASRLRIDEARAASEVRKDFWGFIALLVVLVGTAGSALALVFLPGTSDEMKTAAWSMLSAIVSGAVVHMKGKDDKAE